MPSATSYEAARAAMIESQLRPQGVADPLVLAAMAAVPREQFVGTSDQALAYSDRAIPVGEGRALMPPAALALLVQALAPAAGERALVVGSETGYSAAVLAAMGVTVNAIDGGDGHPLSGDPVDIILVDGAIEAIPEWIVARLEDGGRIAAALFDNGVTRLVVGTKTAGAFGLRSIADAAVPILPGFSRPQSFAF